MAASAEPGPRLELDRAPTAVIGRLHRRMRHRLDHRLERFGLTGVQWTVLAHLGNADGLSQGELQRRLAIEGATLTHIVQRLERDGFIRRSCDPEDRRRQRVWLTEKSGALLPELAEIVAEHRAVVQRGLDDAEIATLSALLRRLEENLL